MLVDVSINQHFSFIKLAKLVNCLISLRIFQR